MSWWLENASLLPKPNVHPLLKLPWDIMREKVLLINAPVRFLHLTAAAAAKNLWSSWGKNEGCSSTELCHGSIKTLTNKKRDSKIHTHTHIVMGRGSFIDKFIDYVV